MTRLSNNIALVVLLHLAAFNGLSSAAPWFGGKASVGTDGASMGAQGSFGGTNANVEASTSGRTLNPFTLVSKTATSVGNVARNAVGTAAQVSQDSMDFVRQKIQENAARTVVIGDDGQYYFIGIDNQGRKTLESVSPKLVASIKISIDSANKAAGVAAQAAGAANQAANRAAGAAKGTYNTVTGAPTKLYNSATGGAMSAYNAAADVAGQTANGARQFVSDPAETTAQLGGAVRQRANSWSAGDQPTVLGHLGNAAGSLWDFGSSLFGAGATAVGSVFDATTGLLIGGAKVAANSPPGALVLGAGNIAATNTANAARQMTDLTGNQLRRTGSFAEGVLNAKVGGSVGLNGGLPSVGVNVRTGPQDDPSFQYGLGFNQEQEDDEQERRKKNN